MAKKSRNYDQNETKTKKWGKKLIAWKLVSQSYHLREIILFKIEGKIKGTKSTRNNLTKIPITI